MICQIYFVRILISFVMRFCNPIDKS